MPELLALELLVAAGPADEWYPAIRGEHRWRLIDEDGLTTVLFEDGFTLDRYACPRGIIFDRSHYRPDGSCYCPQSEK